MNFPPGGGYPPGHPHYGKQGGQPQAQPQQQPYPQQQPQQQQYAGANGMNGQAYPQNGAQQQYGQPAAAPYAQQAQQAPQAQHAYGVPGGYGAPQQQQMHAPAQGGYQQVPGYGGQAAPQQQQGVQMPQFGLGYGAGGVRIGVGGGDFSPTKLMTAVVSGQGFDRPRMMGLLMIGLGILFTAGNFVLIHVLGHFYPYLYSLAAIFWWTGMWLVITGQPRAKPDKSPAPMWSRIGLAAALGFGVLLGIAMSVIPWEAG